MQSEEETLYSCLARLHYMYSTWVSHSTSVICDTNASQNTLADWLSVICMHTILCTHPKYSFAGCGICGHQEILVVAIQVGKHGHECIDYNPVSS